MPHFNIARLGFEPATFCVLAESANRCATEPGSHERKKKKKKKKRS
jgi:hypothetical protein